MTETTKCPACGAPIEYSPDDDIVRCNFCGDEFEVDSQDDQPVLRVRSQPSPQKEVLSAPAERLVEDAAEEVTSEVPGTIETFESEPVASRFATASTEPAELEEFFTQAPDETPPVRVTTISDTPANYEVGSPPVRQVGGPSRWIYIAIAFFVVACLACLCVAGAALAISNGTFGTFNF